MKHCSKNEQYFVLILLLWHLLVICLLCADTTALSMGKTGASTSALFSLEIKHTAFIRKENAKLLVNRP